MVGVNEPEIVSAEDGYSRHRKEVLDSAISYIDVGHGDPILFLHGNPTSSYLWRNVIPHVEGVGRCLAPDLIGMGQSGLSAAGSYRFVDHVRYLDAWIEGLALPGNITLIAHDWGSALAFHWAFRHQDRVKAIIYMEALVAPATWDSWPEESRSIFKALRSPRGDRLILERNLFVEKVLPASVERKLTKEEMDHYRKPYLKSGESRRPTLTWPREIPIEGEPADVHSIVAEYASWLPTSLTAKLFVNVKPGFFSPLIEEHCRTWENQEEVIIPGHHFVQEDSPHALGEAIVNFVRTRRQQKLETEIK